MSEQDDNKPTLLDRLGLEELDMRAFLDPRMSDHHKDLFRRRH